MFTGCSSEYYQVVAACYGLLIQASWQEYNEKECMHRYNTHYSCLANVLLYNSVIIYMQHTFIMCMARMRGVSRPIDTCNSVMPLNARYGG